MHLNQRAKPGKDETMSKKILAFLENVVTLTLVLGFFGFVIFLLYKIFVPEGVALASLVCTLMFVSLGTLIGLSRGRPYTTLSLGGLALYTLSWPMLTTWGMWPSMVTWTLGVLAWIAAIFAGRQQNRLHRLTTA